MKEYINNKYLRYITIVTGVVSLLFVTYFMNSISNMIDLVTKEGSFYSLIYDAEEMFQNAVIGRLNTLINIYNILVILTIVLVAAGAYIKFQLKEEDESTLPVLVGNGISFVLLMMNFNQFRLIKRVISNVELTTSDINIENPIQFFKNFGTLLVLSLISLMVVSVMAFVFEWLMRKGTLNSSLQQSANVPLSMASVPEQTKTMPKIPSVPEKSVKEKMIEFKENIFSYLKTEQGKKTKKYVALGLVVLVALYGISKVLDEMRKPTIDLTEKCELELDGYEASGSAYIACPVEVDGEGLTKEQTEAVNSVEYEPDFGNNEQGKLSNGDKVQIKANYDKDKFELLGLKVTNTEKTLKVSGLDEVYTKYASIPDEDQKKMDDAALGLVQTTFKDKNDEYTRVTEEGNELVAKYYHQNGETSEVIYIYRIDYIYEDRFLKDDDFGDAEKKHIYYMLTFTNLSPEKELVADTTSNDIEVSEIYSAISNNSAIKSVKGDMDDSQYEIEVLLENKSDEKYNQ